MGIILLWFTKLLLLFSRTCNLGAGSTWPGHILLGINPSFLKQFGKQFKGTVIVVAGTNGKTTTSKMIQIILKKNGKRAIHNASGANLLNGVASAIIDATDWNGNLPDLPAGRQGAAIFEVDENTLPLLLNELTPDILVILNLFRDQLDRYGEVDSIAKKWQKVLLQLPKTTNLFLNADDPHITYLAKELSCKVSYFGIEKKDLYLPVRPHAMDAVHCPNCGKKLVFKGIYFSHLGKWGCLECGFKRPVFVFLPTPNSLPGVYNMYNTQAAILVARSLGIPQGAIDAALAEFTPAFGRQEVFIVDGKKAKVFLSKNPTGFNESLRTVKELGARYVLLILNDRIPDGRDVSWIWDVDFEEPGGIKSIVVSGDRAYDMALRMKYASSSKNKKSNSKNQKYNLKFKIYGDLKEAIRESLTILPKNETLYILPTYSAMLEVRKILTGRKIL